MKKQYVSFIVVIAVVSFVFIFFSEPTENDQVVSEVFAEDNRIKPIDYLNLEGEIRALERRIEGLENRLFDTVHEFITIIFDSELLYEVLPFPDSTEILYKTQDDTGHTLFYKDETGYNLLVSSVEERLSNHFHFYNIEPNEDINWWGGGATYNGFITNPDIHSVNVIQNEEIYEASIITIDEDMRVWYSLIDYERKSVSEEPDRMRIEALNQDGDIIWEESFKGSLGG